MRILKTLLLILVLAYGAMMGYLWLKIKGSADDLASSATAFAKVSYDSIYVSPLGNSVGLDGIVIRPNMSNDVFRIEEVRFNVPHAGFFIMANNSMKKGKLPERLGVEMHRVHLDLNSELFTMLDQMQQQAVASQTNEQQNFLSSLDAAGCGKIDTFTLSDARAMGIGEIVADLTASVGYDDIAKVTHLEFTAGADKLYSVDVNAKVDSPPEGIDTSLPETGIPSTIVTYRDDGYHQLRNAYCARLNGSDDKSYVERHIQQMSVRLDATFPEETVNAYRQFMLKGGKIEAHLNPVNNISAGSLQFYKPAQIIEMLGLDLTINGSHLDNSQIAWKDKQSASSTARNDAEKKTTQIVKEERPPARPQVTHSSSTQKKSTPSYHVVKVSDAKKHINQMVEITKYDGKVRGGILDKVNDDRLYLVIQLPTGKLSYPVKVSDVRQLRVFF